MSSELTTFSSEHFARTQIDRHRIISFDVFDTLLLRRVSIPTDVFGLVRLRLLKSASAQFAPIVDTFPELRVRAERLARFNASAEHAGEVTLSEIYGALGEMTALDAAHLALLESEELATERRVAYANPAGKRLFAYARSRKKTIVLISDMYLSTPQIESLLDACGYRDYDALYVSSEVRLSKHAGGMFRYVERRHAARAERPLHIGDNRHGDYVMPLSAGWSAAHLPLSGPASREASRLDSDFARGTVVTSIVDGLLSEDANAETSSGDAWESLGYRVFGPLLCGFAIWLAKNIAARKPEKILYLARDAHFIRSQLPKFLPEPTADEYVYASRGSLLLPSFTDFPLARLVHLISGRTRLSVGRHLRRLGIDPSKVVNVVRSTGFDGLDDLAENGDPRMIALLGKLNRELLHVATSRRSVASRYVERCVGDARHVAVVDIGWSGNIQSAIGRLLASKRDVRVDGFYIGLLDSDARRNPGPGHSMRAWLETTFSGERVSLWWAGGIELLEFAMTAPHGTTLGYEEVDGRVSPVLESSDLLEHERSALERLQTGAGRFIDDALATFGDIIDALDSPDWSKPFLRLVATPTVEEAQMLGGITHGDVAGDTSVRFPLAPLVTDLDDAATLYGRSSWKRGFIVRNALAQLTEFSEPVYLEFNADVRAALEAGAIPSARAHYEEHGEREGRVASWADVT